MKLDSWEQALADAMGDRADTIPKGWITGEQFAEKVGKSDGRARASMRMLMKADKAERKRFNVLRDGRVIPIPHYRLK